MSLGRAIHRSAWMGLSRQVVFGILGELGQMGQLERISQSQFANRGVGVMLEE